MTEASDVDASLQWLLLILPVILIAILMLSRLFVTDKKPRKKSRKSTGKPASKVELRQPASDSRPGTPLSAEEREAMLDGVKNLARENPKKIAGLIRNWMQDE